MTVDHQLHPVSEMGRNDDFYRFHQKHRSNQQPAAVLQSLPSSHPFGAFKPSWVGENETKDNPKPECQCPRDSQGAEWALPAPTWCPALCFPDSQPSQGPGSSLPTGLGVWKPMKHGIVWAAQTQHLPGAWHLSSAALLLVNIWLTYLGEGWGLFAPHPNNPSSRKISYSAGDKALKNHKH